MLPFLAKVRVSNRHLENSIRIANKYYSLGGVLTTDDKEAFVAEIKKLPTKKQDVLIPKSEILSQFNGIDMAANRFMYMFEALVFKSATYNTGIKHSECGRLFLEINGELEAIINALENTSVAKGTDIINVSYPAVSETFLTISEILFGSYDTIELTFDEPVFGTPDLFDFAFSDNGLNQKMEPTSITIDNRKVTIVLDHDYDIGDEVLMNYIKNTDELLRLKNSYGGDVPDLVDVPIYNTIGGR